MSLIHYGHRIVAKKLTPEFHEVVALIGTIRVTFVLRETAGGQTATTEECATKGTGNLQICEVAVLIDMIRVTFILGKL